MKLRIFIIFALIMLVTVLTLSVACSSQKEQRGVIIIVLDALRSDHLSAYGYDRETSPFLDSLAEDSAWFKNTFSAAPQTVPSVSSILTGKYPFQHGAHFFSGNQSYHPRIPVTSGGLPKMKEENKLLAEYMKEEGFFTAGISANPGIRNIYGFAQGLDFFRYINCYTESEAKVCDGARINRLMEDELIPKLEDNDFYIYLHYMDVHNPYFKPNAFKKRFSEFRGEPIYVNGIPEKITPEELQYSIDCYDECIIYLDGLLSSLFTNLREKNLLENTLVIIVSDHGDEFMEHGGLGHGTTCYNELIKSFALISHPSIKNRVFTDRVSLVDIAPTVLDWFNIDYGQNAFTGKSLKPYLTGAGKIKPRAFIAELGDKKAIIAGDTKYIYDVNRKTWEIFNIKDDPRELKPIPPAKLAAFSKYKTMMENIIKKMQLSYNLIELSDEERKNLESLAYIN